MLTPDTPGRLAWFHRLRAGLAVHAVRIERRLEIGGHGTTHARLVRVQILDERIFADAPDHGGNVALHARHVAYDNDVVIDACAADDSVVRIGADEAQSFVRVTVVQRGFTHEDALRKTRTEAARKLRVLASSRIPPKNDSDFPFSSGRMNSCANGMFISIQYLKLAWMDASLAGSNHARRCLLRNAAA